MEQLPSSIEAYLTEAGFSGSEITIINKLVSEDALTIRELAAKTGKSTGVLDQAMKKLIKKGIVDKEIINEVPKYILHSLQSVLDLVKDDTKQKQQMIVRKFENFEAFIATLKKGKHRPEMEYFEGREGIKRAYMQLLDRGRLFLRYGPTLYTAEEDPLRDFRVQYFRERQHRGIFSREITHDTPLGRRNRSRDAFEYRETMLVEEERYPFTFEKIIVGDTVACFQLEKDQACFIRYTELAEDERAFFERMWRKKKQNEAEKDAQPKGSTLPVIVMDAVPTKTRILSQVRDFFLSSRSLVIFGLCSLVAAGLTYAIYQNDANLNLKRIQDKVLSIAATGALQFDANDLNQLHTIVDINKPEYAKVIYLLNAIRKQNDGVKYIYIMRPTEKDGIWEFVADADSLDPYSKKDLNGDGKIDDADHLSPPGEHYVGLDTTSMQFALNKAVALKSPVKNQWGLLLSAFAPIRNADNKTVAILGVDMLNSDVGNPTQDTFTTIYYFLGFFLLFVFIRLAAFNRSLFKEICDLIKIRKVMITLGIAGFASLAITFGLYEYTQAINLHRMQDKVLAIASTAASQFSAKDFDALQVKDDWKKPEWAKVGNQLEKVRKENSDVFYAYVIRKSKADPTKMEFAGDADSINPFANTDNDPTNDVDMNRDGKIDGSPTGGDYQSWPGQPYPTAPRAAFDAYNGPTITSQLYADQWGKFVTGYAPIKDQNGRVAAILAIDIAATSQSQLTNQVFAPIYVFITFFVLFVLFRIPGFSKSLLHQLLVPFKNRLVLLSILFGITVVIGIVFALYEYTLHIMTEEIGTRLMSIAATAAPEFDPNDLAQIHIAADMKKDVYQRVFNKLNEIRKHNEKIQWAYILRLTKEPGILEFVADADSNFYLPFESSIDFNNDGKLDAADENVYPGEAIFDEKVYKNAFIAPYFEDVYRSKWGVYISGYTPIRDTKGNTIAVLGLDMDISDIYNLTNKKIGF